MNGTSFVLRRSAPSIIGLIGLLVAVGSAAVVFGRVPIVAVLVIGVGVVGFEYLISPAVIEWLIPAQAVEWDGTRYNTSEPVGEIVARRCRDAGVPMVRLGIVDDGTPNAFTFGRTRRDARIYVTRGLLDRLDDDELDAVIAHEVGHIRHYDFAVMAAVSLIPMALYLIGRVLLDIAADSDGDDDDEGGALMLGLLGLIALACWYVGELLVLSVNRAREYAADHWSCATTGNGDALVSALMKVAYGMAIEEQRAREAQGHSKTAKEAKACRRAERKQRAVRVMGIFEPAAAVAMHDTLARSADTEAAAAALRWEAVNPWAAWKERFSTHPLVARRIAALEHSGLPGAPTRFTVSQDVGPVSAVEQRELRRRFRAEMAISATPWIALLFGTLLVLGGAVFTGGVAISVAGMAFYAKQHVRYPGRGTPVGSLAELMGRLDAGPVRGIPVEVQGRVVGRDTPGYVASADLTIDDGTALIALHYRQPIPFAHSWFGLTKAKGLVGSEVVAGGWFRRSPQPLIEIRHLREVGGDRRARSVMFPVRLVLAVVVVVAGLVAIAAGMAP